MFARISGRVQLARRRVRALQEALGHVSVETTQRYTAVSGREIRAVSEAAEWRAEAIGRLDPLGP